MNTQQLRQGVFETNSSSTHSICVALGQVLDFPAELHLEDGRFGLEVAKLDTVSEKASYLFTGLFANERESDIEWMIGVLRSKGIAVTADDSRDGYVDHSYELGPFLDAMRASEEALLQYLFSPLSFILTGNDNDDEDVTIDVTYPHDYFYKGN